MFIYHLFCADNDIDGEAFLELAKEDFEKMNLKLGAVVKLLKIQKVHKMHALIYMCIIN